MKNILINGFSSKIGGGKNIFDNFLKQISALDDKKFKFYILAPKSEIYNSYESSNITILKVENIYRNNLFFILLYYYKIPHIVKKYCIDLVFNLGDIVIPLKKISQIYFFDWAFAVYDEKYIWDNMNFKDKFIRRLKVFLIDKYITKVDLVYAQSNNICSRLNSKYKINNIKVVATPISDTFTQKKYGYKDFNFPDNKIKFLYPAGEASHKNFEIIIPLGELIKSKGDPFIIILTVDSESKIMKQVKQRNLTGQIYNINKVEQRYMPSLYQQIDVLFFPSLLESYGIPYIEAMILGKPIITSDFDFAHSICKDYGLYFNPFDTESIYNKMTEVIQKLKVDDKKKLHLDIPRWKDVFDVFYNDMNDLIK